MSAAELCAWAVAAVAWGVAGLAWRELRRGRELVARACHELRGPLTAAHLALHAETRGGERPGEQPRGRLAAVELELRRAALALEDLAAARTGRRAADRAELVDVGDLLAYQAETWEAIAPVFGCDLRVGATPPEALVRGDRVRLAQAVGNLLANALEHGAGTVELAARAQAGRVRIEVSDEGAGLPAPVAELARRPRAGRGHRGRGLAIASDIVARHGGRLVSAPSAGGARLAIELPAWSPEGAAIGPGHGVAR
jgi:signal transduction histidine kinase